MPKHKKLDTVEFEGRVWQDRDYALDADDTLYQLMCYSSSTGMVWEWFMMGTDQSWMLNSTRIDGPTRPLVKVVFHPLWSRTTERPSETLGDSVHGGI